MRFARSLVSTGVLKHGARPAAWVYDVSGRILRQQPELEMDLLECVSLRAVVPMSCVIRQHNFELL